MTRRIAFVLALAYWIAAMAAGSAGAATARSAFQVFVEPTVSASSTGLTLELASGEALLVPLSDDIHDLLPTVAVPLTGLEPPPPNGRVQQRFDAGEVAFCHALKPFRANFIVS